MDLPAFIRAADIADFCRRWQISEFSIFGSALGPEFSPDSDVDVLIDFAPGVFQGIDEWIAMRDELERLFARRVDLVSRSALRNPFRRRQILKSRRVLYASAA
ncbi:MAG: nucleotidyltransferase domain-containing protein [Phycisphaeraceae bacterium]|nr:nucleotidyltransferase domain-containing protein [Phycisphaeraceae bacterium]